MARGPIYDYYIQNREQIVANIWKADPRKQLKPTSTNCSSWSTNEWNYWWSVTLHGNRPNMPFYDTNGETQLLYSPKLNGYI